MFSTKILISQIAAVLGIIATVALLYLGALLPLQKGLLYVKTLRAVGGTVRTAADFRASIERLIRFYSPVGQSEVLKFMGHEMVLLLQSKPAEETALVIIPFIESEMVKDLRIHPGMSSNQKFAVLGAIYGNMWNVYGKIEYAEKAATYYQAGLERSSRRPEFLTGAFFIHASVGDKETAVKLGNKILSYWPQEERVERIMKQLTKNPKS